MPGDPYQCRLNAERCLTLAEGARKSEARQTFITLADTWTRLAAELEADQTFLKALNELQFSEPCEALPVALNLRSRAA